MMPKAIIRLAYKLVIDSQSQTPFEQRIFQTSYAEFRMQQQSFSKGQELFTWSAIRAKFPKSNPALPFKLSFAISGAVAGQKGEIPGLQDTLGLQKIPFVNYRFELIESDSGDSSAHRVALIFLTGSLTLFEVIGERLLVALDQPPPAQAAGEEPSPGNRAAASQTFLLEASSNLSIFNYTELNAASFYPGGYISSAIPFSPGAERKPFFANGL